MPAGQRREFSGSVKRAAWSRCKGRCEHCGKVIWPGDRVYDHIVTCFMSGGGVLENCQVLCRSCDNIKTRGDIKTIAKSKRTIVRHQRHLERMAAKGRETSEARRPRRSAWRVR
jgi:5-methylcytosine-specific restriction endonuclease McrA